MYDSLDKIGLKAVLEAIKGKMPTSLPANGGNADYAANADKLDGLHADDFAKAYNDYLGTYLAGKSGDIRELAYLLPTGGLLANTYYSEFQNITFPTSGDILITWNKSKFSRNGLIYGTLTIQPMTSAGDICICSVYNTTAYTDWQKIYTDWNKPYVTGSVSISYSTETHNFEFLNFTPSAVICRYASRYENDGTIKWATPITNGFKVNVSSTEATSLDYIAFR